MPDRPRYIPHPSHFSSKYYVLDTLGPRAVVQRMFGCDVIYYDTRDAAQTVADALNKEATTMYDSIPATQLQTQFFIFRRNGESGLGYMPQSSPTGRYDATRKGAQEALQRHLDAIGWPNVKTGQYLVQSPHGAWTFEVKPPAPAPLVIEVV